MVAVSEKPQAVLGSCQKAAAWGRVGFGAAGLRPLIPRRGEMSVLFLVARYCTGVGTQLALPIAFAHSP